MIRNLFEKKFHDFPEMAAESISAYTKEENGKTVPMWNKEQVNEIVTAQVFPCLATMSWILSSSYF